MTMSDLPPVPFDGAYRLWRTGVTRRSDAEVQAAADGEVPRSPEPKREHVDDGCQGSVWHGSRMLYLVRP